MPLARIFCTYSENTAVQLHSAVLLAITSMLYTESSKRTHLTTESLNPSIKFAPSPRQPPFYCLLLCVWFFTISHVNEIIWLCFCVWLMLAWCPPGSSMLWQMAGFPSWWLNNISCVCVSDDPFLLFGRTEWHVASYFPDQGSNPCPLQWKHGLPTTELPGKALQHFCFIHPPISKCGGFFPYLVK